MDPWDFGTGFQAPAFTAGVGSGMPVMPQMELPDLIAGHLASQGIRPGQFMQDPGQFGALPGPQQGADNMWDPTPVDMPGGPSVGGMHGGVQTGGPQPGMAAQAGPMSLDDKANAAASSGQGTAPKAAAPGQGIVDMLKGVKAPAGPTSQTIRTPAAPHPTAAIKGGDLMSLLQMIQQNPQKQQALSMSLGQALGGR